MGKGYRRRRQRQVPDWLKNEDFRAPLLKAEELTQIDAAALAALIDAEAAKIKSGPEKGKWNKNSVHPGSGASGLTQFLSSTWLDQAKRPGRLLNTVAKAKGYVSASNGIVAGKRDELLDLRFDSELSIVSAAQFGAANLATLESKGLIPAGTGDDAKARFMYLAHHEGATGAEQFLKKKNPASKSKSSSSRSAASAKRTRSSPPPAVTSHLPIGTG